MMNKREKQTTADEESKQTLLNNLSADTKQSNDQQTSSQANGKASSKKQQKVGSSQQTDVKPSKTKSTWSNLAQKVNLLWPYVWPSGKPTLQVRVILCVIIIIVTRGVNVLVPIFYKKIVNSLTPDYDSTPVATQSSEMNLTNQEAAYKSTANPVVQSMVTVLSYLTNTTTATNTPSSSGVEYRWDYILVFIVLKSLHGSSGYLNCLRSFLWIKVSQNSQKKMRLRLFSHLHHLSVKWHLNRKTGEVIRVMDRGVQSINLILSHVLFNIVPVIVDIIIAIIYFITVFNVWTGLIVFTTMLGYLIFTILISEWRIKHRRKMNESDNARNAASVDSILNFETVKYYCAEDWEVDRYEGKIDKHQEAEWWVSVSLNMLNALQKTMMMLGLLGGSLLCAWYVYTEQFTVGDFVLFASYVDQLYGPLNMFGAYYRVLQQAFVDMEHMFQMLEEKQDVIDSPDAPPLSVPQGEIQFKDVSFEYIENHPILKGINFTVPPGQTYALVGHSGGGKSTIIKLLFRFYDITSGAIIVDGEDISKVNQKSLRQHIGVVPQDTVLFNQDLRYNIRYGRVGATDNEVEDAARAADIHEKILTLHDGYESKVGERGLKLSGGEKQRVAIARTILKGPNIVLLDEATSALDTRTERNIQHSLRRLCENKTTLIVAHRLSTVTHADKILVIEDGQIVESGTDMELRRFGGHYAQMWQEQLQSGEIDTDPEQPETQPEFSLYTSQHSISSTDRGGECCCSCHRHSDNTDPPSYGAIDDGHTTTSDEDEIEIPVTIDRGDKDKKRTVDSRASDSDIRAKEDDSDSLQLISSGNVYSLKPRFHNYDRTVSVPVYPAAGLPLSRSFSEMEKSSSRGPEELCYRPQRSYTSGDPGRLLHRRLFQRQASCPSYKCRLKEFKQSSNKREQALEKEREQADALREEDETYLSGVMAEDLTPLDSVADNEGLLDSLSKSQNSQPWSKEKCNCFSSDTVIHMPKI